MDVTYGNVSVEEAERLANAAGSVDDVPHEPGSTEPWVSRLVADFIIARGARTVLETGCFKGATSVWIADALQRLGGGTVFIFEMDRPRAEATSQRLKAYPLVNVRLYVDDAIAEIKQLEATSVDIAFIDDCHEKQHVEQELTLLYPKMTKGGLILLHDVYGSCDLQSVVKQFGGYSINLPRLGPAGGLGIIQT